MTKFATSATEFGKKSNHISGAVERKHFITGRITIHIPTICILGWPIFKSRIKTGGDKKIWGKYEFPCA